MLRRVRLFIDRYPGTHESAVDAETMDGIQTGYARAPTVGQDLTAQRDALLRLGVEGAHIYGGLVQTVLYTDYVRSARPVYDWFERRGLDAASARGVLAIPPLTPHSRNGDVLTHTSSLAKALGVEFCQLRRR